MYMYNMYIYVFLAEGVSPKATAIEVNSNDHYILDSIVFSSLIGLRTGGAANMISGLHVWFPWNKAVRLSLSLLSY